MRSGLSKPDTAGDTAQAAADLLFARVSDEHYTAGVAAIAARIAAAPDQPQSMRSFARASLRWAPNAQPS